MSVSCFLAHCLFCLRPGAKFLMREVMHDCVMMMICILFLSQSICTDLGYHHHSKHLQETKNAEEEKTSPRRRNTSEQRLVVCTPGCHTLCLDVDFNLESIIKFDIGTNLICGLAGELSLISTKILAHGLSITFSHQKSVRLTANP